MLLTLGRVACAGPADERRVRVLARVHVQPSPRRRVRLGRRRHKRGRGDETQGQEKSGHLVWSVFLLRTGDERRVDMLLSVDIYKRGLIPSRRPKLPRLSTSAEPSSHFHPLPFTHPHNKSFDKDLEFSGPLLSYRNEVIMCKIYVLSFHLPHFKLEPSEQGRNRHAHFGLREMHT